MNRSRGRRFVPPRFRIHWDNLEARRLMAGVNGTFAGVEPPSIVEVRKFAPLVAVPGDYDGDGNADLGLFDRAAHEWLIVQTGLEAPEGYRWAPPKPAIPIPADYDGDGKADLAYYVWSSGHWVVRLGDRDEATLFGNTLLGDIPAPADYDGDGKADLAVYRPNESRWLVNLSGGGVLDTVFGVASSQAYPLPADYDGDGRANLAVFDPGTSTWVIQAADGEIQEVHVGELGPGDQPVAADFDGDGKADPAIFRAATGAWEIAGSSAGPTTDGFDSALIPVRRIDQASEAAHGAMLRQASTIRPHVLFLGDSITAFWGSDPSSIFSGQQVWQSTMAPLRALNLGMAADSSRSLLWRVTHGAVASKPRVVVLMVGINDLKSHQRTPADIARTIAATVEAIHQQSPRTRVILHGVLPADFGPDTRLRSDIRALNELLALLDDGRFVQFFDFGDSLLDSEGWLRPELMPDGLHLSSAGYEVWAVTIFDTLVSLLKNWSQAPGVDFDADGKADLVVYRRDRATWLGSLSGGDKLVASLGSVGSMGIPVPADYDGDGRADLAFFLPSNALWVAVLSGGGVLWKSFGAPNLLDIPVPADYDGDGQADLAVFRPSEARWLSILSGGGVLSRNFGAPNLLDIPVPADYDGDGKADLAVFRPSASQWLSVLSGGGVLSRSFGAPDLLDIPVPADYDGDGKADLAVFRPSEARWLSKLSLGGTMNLVFGAPDLLDLPVAAPIGALASLRKIPEWPAT